MIYCVREDDFCFILPLFILHFKKLGREPKKKKTKKRLLFMPCIEGIFLNAKIFHAN